MKKSLLFSFLFATSTLISFSQSSDTFQKEFRISSGLGIAGSSKNLKAIGPSFWIQMEYLLVKNISIATEFENMKYVQPGFYEDLPVNPNENNVYNNNFSFLLKYHIISGRKAKLAVSSGLSYNIELNDYYIYRADDVSQSWFKNVSASNDYRIPFIIESGYSISNKINLLGRFKYNVNRQNGNILSGGLGLSLKL